MRRDGIPYVKNPRSYYPPIDINKMSYEEIVQKYIKTCGKANGEISVCSKCPTPCPEGRRAIQMLANEVYSDPPIPLYGGKTLIERAKEENMLRRQKLEEEQKAKEEQKMEETKKSKDNRQYIDNWYEKAVASGDPVKWVMEQYGMTKAKAKHKIYSWKYRHQIDEPAKHAKVKEEPVPVVKVEQPVIIKETAETDSIEAKIDSLMKLQEKHKNIMLEMQQQYEKAKAKYEEISKKVDILCNAMDIMNE